MSEGDERTAGAEFPGSAGEGSAPGEEAGAPAGEPAAAAQSPDPDHAARIAPDVLTEVAREVGTPAYLYDGRALDAGVRRWTGAARRPADVLYSVKASSNLSVLRRLAGHGIGFEAATPGEVARLERAGVPPGRIVLGGVPKAARAVREALSRGVALTVLQAENEVRAVEEAAAEGKTAPPEPPDAAAAGAPGSRPSGRGAPGAGDPARVGLRVLPGVRAGAHPSLETGSEEAKFGFRPEEAVRAWGRLADLPRVRPAALAVHLGSGLRGPGPYLEALEVLLEAADAAAEVGPRPAELDLGGGLGVSYGGGPDPEPRDLVEAVEERLGGGERGEGPAPGEAAARGDAARGDSARSEGATSGEGGGCYRLRFEPGRSVCARAGVLLTRVLYRRRRRGRPVLVCDAGFTDFSRPVLYGARHRIEPVEGAPAGEPTVDVLGPTCESGDVLGVGRSLHGVGQGDLLAVRGAGGYGFVMASTYNSRPRAPEVLVEDGEAGRWRVVRRREAARDLWRGEEEALEG